MPVTLFTSGGTIHGDPVGLEPYLEAVADTLRGHGADIDRWPRTLGPSPPTR